MLISFSLGNRTEPPVKTVTKFKNESLIADLDQRATVDVSIDFLHFYNFFNDEKVKKISTILIRSHMCISKQIL